MKNSRNVCSKLWTDINIDLCTPIIRRCCKQEGYHSSINELRDLGSNFFEMFGSNIPDRKSMVFDGELPDSCAFCKQSKNSRIMDVWNSWDDKFIETRESKLIEDNHTDCITLDIGNNCNMSCVYCGSNRSTMWAKELGLGTEVYKHIDNEWKDEILYQLSEYLVTKHSRNYIIFNIVGGEPLIIPAVYSLINSLAKICTDARIKPIMTLTTNMNIKPAFMEKFVDLVNSTKHIFTWHLAVSIEDVGERAEYVRYGLDWELFTKNMNIIKDIMDKIFITTTLTIFSYPSFDEFIEWCFEIMGAENYPNSWNFTLNSVQDGFSDVSYLDKTQDNCQRIVDKYVKLINDSGNEVDFINDRFIAHMNNLSCKIGSKKRTNNFHRYWESMSARRGVQYSDTPVLTYLARIDEYQGD